MTLRSPKKPKSFSVGILMVATNDYLNRWKESAKTLNKFAFLNHDEINIHLFTNHDSEAATWAKDNLTRTSLIVHKIPGWGWPEATLYRYKFFANDKDMFTEDILMYCDSDMVVVADFSDLLDPSEWLNGLAFVSHPGFHRNAGLRKVVDVFKDPKLLGPNKDRLRTRSLGLGSWEENELSTAYVEPEHRKKYVHGAVWFGKRESFLQMCRILSENVRRDEANGYIAKWHDESHLNWYLAKFGATVLTCELSGVASYKHLSGINMRILTVEKELGEGRSPTKHTEVDNA